MHAAQLQHSIVNEGTKEFKDIETKSNKLLENTEKLSKEINS